MSTETQRSSGAVRVPTMMEVPLPVLDQQDFFGLHPEHYTLLSEVVRIERPDAQVIALVTEQLRQSDFIPDCDEVTEEQVAALFGGQISGVRAHLLALRQSDRLAGFAICSTGGLPHPSERFRREVQDKRFPDSSGELILREGDGVLLWYCVLPEDRNRGCARALIAGVRALARTAGCKRLVAFNTKVIRPGSGSQDWGRDGWKRMASMGFSEVANFHPRRATVYVLAVTLPPPQTRPAGQSFGGY